ncbi:hypothetical protein VQ042_19095 [Aurantimonas sp. A2-1-M11]|uniref:hypothetical protein n=1 Tax=Aurantimonas sp. A2-1-M11 TaxID=3113712 RepID=UPI002F929EF0
MSGYQFIHFEAYSRSGGKSGRSVSYVLDEAERRPGATPHIERPRPPIVVYGTPIADLRSLHNERSAAARQEIAGGRLRSIRKDQLTLLTAVASHPTPCSAIAADPAAAAAVADWEQRTVDWLRQRYGDRLETVIRHDDEAYPHLHAYVLPDDSAMRASALHDGMAAKAASMHCPLPADPDERKARNRTGDRAYRDAMRFVQTSYWQDVGLPCGLARLGPRRRRLTREAWQAEQLASSAQARSLSGAKRIKEQGEAYVTRTKERCSLIYRKAHRVLQEAEARKEAAEAEWKAAASERAETQRLLAEARKSAAPAVSLGAAFGTVISAARETLTDRETTIRREAESAAQPAVAEAEKRMKDAENKAERAVQQLLEERQRSEALRASATAAADQRDAAWRRLAEIDPDFHPDTPKPQR